MSIDLEALEVKANETFYRTTIVEDRVSVLESVTRSLNNSTARLVTEADLDLLRGELNELWNIVDKLKNSVEQLDSQLNALSVNQLL